MTAGPIGVEPRGWQGIFRVAQIKVDSVTALTSALKSAQSGDTILLAPGAYSGAVVSGLSFASGITITSADPAHQAVLTNFKVVGSTGLTFTNLEFFAQAPATFAFQVNNSSNIHFDHISMHGSLDGNASNDASGLQIMGSSKITVTNSEFQQLARAIGVSTTNDVTIGNNYVHDIRSDGFDFAQVSFVKVIDNVLKNFAPGTTDHPDAIQFWTQGTTAASHDILISGNLILRGDGNTVQGIFMGDEVGTMPLERVTIANNLIVGTGYNAIRLNGAKDLTLTNNELITYQGDYKTFLLIQKADGVVATGNKAIAIAFDNSTNVVQSGNISTASVADHGQAALDAWFALHPEDKAVLSGVAPTPPPSTETSTEAPEPLPPTAPEPPPTILKATAASPDVTGTSGANEIYGDYRVNKFMGMGGNDTLDGGGGYDTLMGGTGNDTYIVPNVGATIVENVGEGIDTIIAKGDYVLPTNVENLVINITAGNSWAGTGNALANQITGNSGHNRLDGLAGNDTIDGGLGNDIIVGNTGNDRLTGGMGVDTFRFTQGGGKDVITDLGSDDSRDLIDVSAYLKAGLKPVLQDVGSDVVISFSNGDSITVLGVHASQLGYSQYGWVF